MQKIYIRVQIFLISGNLHAVEDSKTAHRFIKNRPAEYMAGQIKLFI